MAGRALPYQTMTKKDAMMSENNDQKNIEIDNILGPGYEPLAVCLVVLFIWIAIVSFGAKFFM
jgi:hypothetical protein